MAKLGLTVCSYHTAANHFSLAWHRAVRINRQFCWYIAWRPDTLMLKPGRIHDENRLGGEDSALPTTLPTFAVFNRTVCSFFIRILLAALCLVWSNGKTGTQRLARLRKTRARSFTRKVIFIEIRETIHWTENPRAYRRWVIFDLLWIRNWILCVIGYSCKKFLLLGCWTKIEA